MTRETLIKTCKMIVKGVILCCILIANINALNDERKVQRRDHLLRRIPPSMNSSSTFAPFIINGKPADIEDYPFKLSLHIDGTFFCGASVIHSRWSLTAAHCLEFVFLPESITLIGGTANRVTGGVTFVVEQFYMHPNYDPIILDFDVGVMRIRGTFDGHYNIRPVLLANEGCSTTSGLVVTVAGWGMNEKGFYPEELYEIQQFIIDNDKCYDEWGGDITSRMLCAAVVDEIDSCSGDSGGAVLKNGCMQVGIISFGSNICGYPIPSVFTRIEDPAIRGFIRRITGV